MDHELDQKMAAEAAWERDMQTEDDHQAVTTQERRHLDYRTCKYCGEEFRHEGTDAAFCDDDCALLHQQ